MTTISFEIDFYEEFLMTLKKIDSFLTEIRQNPTEETGKPEQLKYLNPPSWLIS